MSCDVGEIPSMDVTFDDGFTEKVLSSFGEVHAQGIAPVEMNQSNSCLPYK